MRMEKVTHILGQNGYADGAMCHACNEETGIWIGYNTSQKKYQRICFDCLRTAIQNFIQTKALFKDEDTNQ